MHCQHIFFGGSGDNGYARLLGEPSGDEELARRITLIEGPPFAYETAQLRGKLDSTRLGQVFRKTKIGAEAQPGAKRRRMDSPSPEPPQKLYDAMCKVGKPCMLFYLLGNCPDGEKCSSQKSHTRSHTAAELELIRRLASLLLCKRGAECRNVDCIYTHPKRLTAKICKAG